MNPVIRIPELRSFVCENLEGCSTSLLALALTCKELSESFLDALWMSQESLCPLVKTMPSDLWEEAETGERSSEVEFLRPLEESDWTRYHHYASKVRHLALTDSLGFGVAFSALLAMCTYYPYQQLLPSLSVLKITLQEDMDAKLEHYTSFLLGRGLMELHLIAEGDVVLDKLNPILRALPRLSPNLRVLTIQDECGDGFPCIPGYFDEEIQRAIIALSKLEVLDVWALEVSSSFLRNLIPLSLHSLGELIISETTVSLLEREPSLRNLPALTTLRLYPSDWPATCTLLHCLSSSPLKSFWCRPRHSTPTMSMQTFAWLFTTVTRFRDLTELSIYLEMENPDSAVVEEVFSSILQLRELRSLDLESVAVSTLSNKWFWRLPVALPHIQTLALTTPLHENKTPQISLEDLVPVIQQCRNLHSLETTVCCLPFNYTRLYQSQPSNISSVAFINCPLKQPERLLSCLLFLFPRVKQLQCLHNDSAESREWATLKKLYSKFTPPV